MALEANLAIPIIVEISQQEAEANDMDADLIYTELDELLSREELLQVTPSDSMLLEMGEIFADIPEPDWYANTDLEPEEIVTGHPKPSKFWNEYDSAANEELELGVAAHASFHKLTTLDIMPTSPTLQTISALFDSIQVSQTDFRDGETSVGYSILSFQFIKLMPLRGEFLVDFTQNLLEYRSADPNLSQNRKDTIVTEYMSKPAVVFHRLNMDLKRSKIQQSAHLTELISDYASKFYPHYRIQESPFRLFIGAQTFLINFECVFVSQKGISNQEGREISGIPAQNLWTVRQPHLDNLQSYLSKKATAFGTAKYRAAYEPITTSGKLKSKANVVNICAFFSLLLLGACILILPSRFMLGLGIGGGCIFVAFGGISLYLRQCIQASSVDDVEFDFYALTRRQVSLLERYLSEPLHKQLIRLQTGITAKKNRGRRESREALHILESPSLRNLVEVQKKEREPEEDNLVNFFMGE